MRWVPRFAKVACDLRSDMKRLFLSAGGGPGPHRYQERPLRKLVIAASIILNISIFLVSSPSYSQQASHADVGWHGGSVANSALNSSIRSNRTFTLEDRGQLPYAVRLLARFDRANELVRQFPFMAPNGHAALVAACPLSGGEAEV
jgi:hypothetical protein